MIQQVFFINEAMLCSTIKYKINQKISILLEAYEMTYLCDHANMRESVLCRTGAVTEIS